MTDLTSLRSNLPTRLAELAARHGVVGACVALQLGDEVVEAATGVTNLRTHAPVSTDTLFQIGSITKVYTATLVMQLVDEGLVDLDQPVTTYIEDFRLADADAAAAVTVRQLLSHTSGMDGDVFDEFGRGDDCVARYVEAMADLVQTSPPGAFFSYCNSGYVLLGRLIEQLRGTSWDVALRSHLLEPLGLDSSVTLAEQAILRNVAVGHLPTGDDGAPQVAPVWFMSRALGPAGAIVAPARDVLKFARMHLDDGRAADGRQLLSPGSAKLMRELVVTLPEPYTLGDGWGLGWILYQMEQPGVIGHDGATIGQQAYLRVVPDAGLSFVLLGNGGALGAVFNDLARPILAELAGVVLRDKPVPPVPPLTLDASAFLGTYSRSGVDMSITAGEDSDLWLEVTATGPLAGAVPQQPPIRLAVMDDAHLVTADLDPRLGQHLVLTFLEPAAGSYRYVHFGGRATPRASGDQLVDP